jgi:hypothetical protein
MAQLVLFSSRVKWLATSKHQQRGVRFAAGAVLLLWLVTFALGASPQLHRLLHPDADSSSHKCLITQIQQQSFAAGIHPPVAPPVPATETELVCSAEVRFLSARNYRLSPSRAPPAVPTATVAG